MISSARTSLRVGLERTLIRTARRPLARHPSRTYTTVSAAQRHLSAAAAVPAFDSSSFDDPDRLFQKISLEQIHALAAQRPTPLRLADMYKYGRGEDPKQRLRNAQFLHRELPIRIAQRAVDLLTLPHGLSTAEPIRKVASMYLEYMVEMQKFPVPTTYEEEEEFTKLISGFVWNRTTIPTSIARGVTLWRKSLHNKKVPAEVEQEMEEALYRFFTARVGLRLLTEHHVLSSKGNSERKAAVLDCMQLFKGEKIDVGCIKSDLDVVYEVKRVAALVREQTMMYLELAQLDKECPEIIIVDCNKEREPFTFVPHHLHYIVSELLKNSIRATLRHGLNEPIKVVIAKGAEDVTIKIADRGGGIPRSRMSTIWKFSHSTKQDAELETEFGADGVSGASIRGFGLPLARIYARYLGGELTLKSTEGYGLDTYLYLPCLGDSCEHLPLRVRHSPGELDSMPTMFDERVDQIKKQWKKGG